MVEDQGTHIYSYFPKLCPVITRKVLFAWVMYTLPLEEPPVFIVTAAGAGAGARAGAGAGAPPLSITTTPLS